MKKKIAFLLVLVSLVLTACGVVLPGEPPTATAALTQVPAVQPTYTPYPTQAPPTATPEAKLIVDDTATPTAEPTATPMATATGNCQDGAPTGLPKNKIERTPIGDGQYLTVQEISVKPGRGFTDFDRWVQVTAALSNTHQVFNLDVETLNEKRYCGTVDAVKAYLSDPNTHVWAMRQSAADGNGNIPPVGEIPVVFINPTTGEITFLVAPTAATAPTLATIKNHIEIVKLTSVAPAANANQPTTVAIASTAACGPATELDLGPWVAQERTVTGPAIVNVGFPNEGTTMYRTQVQAGDSVMFLAAAGKAWKFDSGCAESEIQRQLTANAGGITVIPLDDLVTQGKAKK